MKKQTARDLEPKSYVVFLWSQRDCAYSVIGIGYSKTEAAAEVFNLRKQDLPAWTLEEIKFKKFDRFAKSGRLQP